MRFKRYSTERVLKSIVGELTDQKFWSVKGDRMGDCWYKDCCVTDHGKGKCTIAGMSGENKIMTLLLDDESQKLIKLIELP